jgi:hypothetical protein
MARHAFHASFCRRTAFGGDKIEHYSAGKGVPPGNGNVVLLYAANAENISIEGNGTLDGQGAKFYTGKGDNTGPGQNREQGYVNRPHLAIFRFTDTRDVLLSACRVLTPAAAFLSAEESRAEG